MRGKGCAGEVARKVQAWNAEAGEMVVYASVPGTENEHMLQVFFENADSGNAMH